MSFSTDDSQSRPLAFLRALQRSSDLEVRGGTWSLVAIELVRSVRVLDGREAGSPSGPQILRFTPAGFGEQPEQHHDQGWRQEGNQPGCCEPMAGAGHRAKGDQ